MSDRRLEVVLAAKDMTGATFTKFQNRIKGLSSSVFSMQTAMVAAAGAAGLGALVKTSLNAADKIGKVSDAIGITTDSLQEYRYAADLSGVSTQALDKSILGFSKRLGEAKAGSGSLAEYLKKANSELLAQVQASGSADKALKLVFDAMGDTADASDRAALAAAAFGRSGVEMAVMVKNGAAGLNTMTQEARDLGLVLDEDLIRKSEAANDAMTKVTTTLKTGMLTAVGSLAPEITTLAEGMADWIKANKDVVKGKIIDFMNKATAAAKRFYAAVQPIITTAFDVAKNMWGWFNSLPSGVMSLGLVGYILAGPAGVATVAAIGAIVKDIQGDMELAKQGLIDADGSLDIYSEAWYAAQAATKKAKEELEDYGDILVEGTDKIADNTKAIGDSSSAIIHNTTAVVTNAEAQVKAAALAENGYGNMFASVSQGMLHIGGEWDYVQDQVYEKTEATLGATGTVPKAANSGFDAIGQALESNLTAAFQGEFDSIGGFFEDLLGSMYSMFVSWAAKVAAQQILFNVSSGSAGANTLSAMMSGGSGGGGMSSAMNFASLAAKAKSGYSYVTGGGLTSQFYTPAATLPSGVAGPTTSGGLTSTGYLGIIGAAIAAQHMATGYSQKHGYNDVWVNGKKQTIGDAFSGQFFNDPATSLLTGLSGGHTSGLQYADAAMMQHDWPEFFKGMGVGTLDLLTGLPFINPIAKLLGLGDKPEHSSFTMQAGLSRDANGNLVGTGVGPNPMSGNDFWGSYLYGEGPKHDVNEPFGKVDDYIGTLMDAFGKSVDLFSDSLITPLKGSFDQAVDDLIKDFKFTGTGRSREDIGEYLQANIDKLSTSLGDLVAPTVAAFTDLQDALGLVTPAFSDLLNSLSDATEHYFNPLLDIDQKILASSDDMFTKQFKYTMYEDQASQVGSYKTLYDNAVANNMGFDSIVKFGNLYTDALTNFQELTDGAGMYASGFAADSMGSPSKSFLDAYGADLTTVLKSLRDNMLEAGGSPQDFQDGVMQSLTTFKSGIDDGIAALVTAIKDLHPEIDLDIDVGVKVVGDHASTSATAVSRSAA